MTTGILSTSEVQQRILSGEFKVFDVFESGRFLLKVQRLVRVVTYSTS
jgi:hypothetical protein